MRSRALALTTLTILAAEGGPSSAAMVAAANTSMSMDAAIDQIEKTAVNTAEKAAADVCKRAIDAALGLQPQLQKSYADLQTAEAQIAPAQQKLHLASVPLQNTDCASDAKKNDPTCQKLDAAYEAARSEVLSQLGPVQAAGSAYTKIQASYGKTVANANTVCLVQLAASIPTLVGDDWALLQSLYSGLNDLVAKAAASSAPDLTAIFVDLIPRPRLDVGGQFAGTYLFRGIAGQTCQIRQQSDGSIVAISEKGDRGQGKVTGANTFTVTFSFGELQGTLSSDGKEIKWSNGERWVRT